MAMLPIISTDQYVRIAVIDDYISFIWTPRYYTSGDFELVISIQHINLIHIGYHVERDDDENIGIIEKIQIERREDGQEVAIISGRFLLSLLGRRIVARQSSFYQKSAGYVIGSLIFYNAMETGVGPQTYRVIPDLETMEGMDEIGPDIDIQITGKNLLDAVSQICESTHIGIKAFRNSAGFIEVFLYEGTDRSINQSAVPHVIFSEQYDNLISSSYEENHKNIISAVLVAGEGEGLSRKMKWAELSTIASGLNRYEYFKDARNVQSNGGQISDEEYKDMLKGVGKELLTQYTQAFGAQVDFSNIKYKQDVNLGDLVTLRNERWGVTATARLVEVIESTDESGMYTINPTFMME